MRGAALDSVSHFSIQFAFFLAVCAEVDVGCLGCLALLVALRFMVCGFVCLYRISV